MDKQLHDAFENCLVLIQNGIEVERALLLYPDLGDELKEPLSTAAMLVRKNAMPTAESRVRSSRQRVLAGSREQEKRPSWFSFSSLRVRPAWALATAVFVVSVSGVLTASAAALPGGTFYPLKLAMERLRYAITLSAQSQADLEVQLRRERVYEAQALIEGGLQSTVSLQGRIDRISQSLIIVDGIPVQVPDDWEALETTQVGDWILVDGNIEDGIVLASSAQHIPATWTGLIESMDPSTWIIDGRAFIIDSATSGTQSFQVGDLVTVIISPDIQGAWRASSLIHLEGETLAEALADLAQEENERVAEWSGQIVSIHPTWVQIGQVVVRTGEWTEIEPDLQPGYWVMVKARWDGDWWALEIETIDELDFDLTPDRELFEDEEIEDLDEQEFEDHEHESDEDDGQEDDKSDEEEEGGEEDGEEEDD